MSQGILRGPKLVEHLKQYDLNEENYWKSQRQTAKLELLVKDNLELFSEAGPSFTSFNEEMKFNLQQINAIGEELSEMTVPKRRRTEENITSNSSYSTRPKKDTRGSTQRHETDKSASRSSEHKAWYSSGSRDGHFADQRGRTQNSSTRGRDRSARPSP